MRGYFVSLVLLGMIAPSISWARSNDIPTLDVRPVCRGIASQSGDPGLGVAGQTETFRQCMESEQAVLEQLRKEWSAFSAADKRHCVTLAKTGGESSNTELMTCLEMARDVRVMRSAAAAATSSRVDDTKATPSPSTPTAQPAHGSAPQEATPPKQPPKADGDSTIGEVERAKAEAQTAKESEALTQRKLADAEAALQRLKDEAARAKADAERAKADAKAARESEVAAARKFADAEAARVAAVKACHGETKPRPVLERLRGLFRRGTKND